MKTQQQVKEQTQLVSRKTNEEIDVDEQGNLIIDGRYVPSEPSIVPHGLTEKSTPADANPDDDEAKHIED